MSGINYIKYRIKFEKTGISKYLSHLDLNRLFSRSLARAKIDVAHTEGFNPHPKIVFASAISLGIESFCEFADVKININVGATIGRPLPNDNNDNENHIFYTDAHCAPLQIYEKIKNVFPQGINIKEIYIPETEFKEIDTTRFYIFFSPDDYEADEIIEMFKNDVFVEKKPGIVINLKDYIRDISISDKLHSYKFIDCIIKTNQEMFLNPENIVKAINLKYNTDDYFIQKIESYDKNGKVFK